MKISVKKTLTLHAIAVAILLVTPTIALHWVSSQGVKSINRANFIYSDFILQLTNIDSYLKNARFHAYAGFMHDEGLFVSKYHAHPFELHLNAVDSEMKSAERSWGIILASNPREIPHYSEVIDLKSQYDNYIEAGAAPVLNALKAKNWESIVKITTASIPQYSDFSIAIQGLLGKVRQSASLENEKSLKQLLLLEYFFDTIYIFSIILYIIFSFWLQRRIINPLTESMGVAKKIASGDLTKNIIFKRDDEFGLLSASMEQMRAELSSMIAEVISAAGKVSSSSQLLEQASSSTVKSISEQMNRLTSSESVLGNLLVSIDNISKNSEHTRGEAVEAENAASISSAHVSNTEKSIQEVFDQLLLTGEQVEALTDKFKEITNITVVIQNVAAKTNLLALNAAIEAARAGEQGRGFAVVADEVRNLAATTTNSIEQISITIADIQKNAAATVLSMRNSRETSDLAVQTSKITRESIETIKGSTSLVQERISDITRALSGQKLASDELSTSIEYIAKLSRENNSKVTEVSILAKDFLETSIHLRKVVSGFQLD